MKILFLVPYPLDKAPSQRFRFEQYLTHLVKLNCKFTIKPFLSTAGWNIFYSGHHLIVLVHIIFGLLRRSYHLLLALSADYVFIHRELTPLGPPIYEWIIAKVIRKKIIYDFDDAIWLEDLEEKGTIKAWFKWKSKVSSICKWSYKVSVGNEYLAEFARKFNNNIFLIPTTLDTNNHHSPSLLNSKKDAPPTRRAICIGWTGTHSTMPYLQLIVSIINKIYESHEIIFRVISNKKPALDLKAVEFVKWSKELEIEDLMDIDIGIMPLSDDPWSKGKCGFKALQYLSLEKPALVSPVGVNAEIVKHGETGFHCLNDEDWHKYLIHLIENEEERLRLGRNGRKFVEKHYSLEANKSNFLNLFTLPS